ncbi:MULTISPECIES: hypothetical protein [Paenibacillus]|uniref:DUF5107 domain-containing protein n=1 Tax=Paenibacillus albilobatus TaxID=2716884 RepID=A0A919XCE9_9BACL|nr:MULTISPECIES: hypothetical protein [Paenibacillus]GIO29596.1 hypothetical protein J2TS6_07370 [Paenibacillus albilobatus]
MKKSNGFCCYSGVYKQQESVIAESEIVRIELVPALGGKWVSLIHKPSGKEWLLDSGDRPLKQPVYGSAFTDWDMSGWDECFPTINPCVAELDNDRIQLPDHGELWSLPWSIKCMDNAIECSVVSPNMPYRLKRRISFSAPDCVNLEYSVQNLSAFMLHFLWVPHPQFAVSEPTRILLPPEVDKMLCVFGFDKFKAGESYAAQRMSLVSPEKTGAGSKFYYPGYSTAGWSGLHGQVSDCYLILSVSPDEVPFLGVWIDEGMFNDRVTCALEPGIGYYDSLETAVRNGTAQYVPPNDSFAWQMKLWLGRGNWEDSLPAILSQEHSVI